LTQGLTEEDLVLCLISGGGSALLTLPCEGLTLEDKQRINRQLLESGADIAQMNTVRKHLSRIKGGRLAAACAPARVLTLAISDVPGDDPSVIASGPTVADGSTCADTLEILDRYAIAVPPAVREGLQSGALETPKPGDPRLARCVTHLIATPQQSLEAAAAAARALGWRAYILSDEIEGESREVGKVHAAIARSTALGRSCFEAPCVILSGGETTVTVRPPAAGQPRGRGGRAGEFCMGLAQALAGHPRIWGLAADTDGIDGVEDNAGAFVTPDTLARASALGLKLADHLARNDAYGFFEPLGDLLVTGPTHTNVNDFRAVLVR
jgi:hydroxypyruvate reductase